MGRTWTVYSDRGHGVRAVVFYNWSNEAAARLKPGDFDWKAVRRRRPLVSLVASSPPCPPRPLK